jgi:hypothetical protein
MRGAATAYDDDQSGKSMHAQLRVVLSHAMQMQNCQGPARAIDTYK